jgi:hypothetical protein
MERVFYVEGPGGTLIPPPAPAQGAFDRLGAFRAAVVSNIGFAVPLSIDQVVALYRGDRRFAMYARAAESLRHEPLSKRDAQVKTFVKAEKINFDAKTDPAPRVIQPRSPRYNLHIGRFLKTLEKRVYTAIAAVYRSSWATVGPIVCKGLTARTLACALRRKWQRFDNPVAIGLDASRFDQHVSTEALRWEHSVYERVYSGRDRDELRRLLEWQRVNYGTARLADAKVRYVRQGCRMSGDINTSLGNCLIMCALIHQYCTERGLVVDLANNGDDCVVFMERRDAERFRAGLSEWFLEMGFTMKIEDTVDVFEKVEFCQTQPVWDGTEWIMCRNPVGLSKDAYSLLPWGQGAMAYGWATAIADSGEAIAATMPIFAAFYAKLRVLGRGITMGNHPLMSGGGLKWLSDGSATPARHHGVTDAARVSFWRAFGIPPYMQVLAETHIAGTDVSLDTRSVKLNTLPHYKDPLVASLRHYRTQ